MDELARPCCLVSLKGAGERLLFPNICVMERSPPPPPAGRGELQGQQNSIPPLALLSLELLGGCCLLLLLHLVFSVSPQWRGTLFARPARPPCKAPSPCNNWGSRSVRERERERGDESSQYERRGWGIKATINSPHNPACLVLCWRYYIWASNSVGLFLCSITCVCV